MLTVRLNPELETRLEELALATGRSKSDYARLAIEEFLDGRGDYLLAINILESDEPTTGIDDLRRELGI